MDLRVLSGAGEATNHLASHHVLDVRRRGRVQPPHDDICLPSYTGVQRFNRVIESGKRGQQVANINCCVDRFHRHRHRHGHCRSLECSPIGLLQREREDRHRDWRRIRYVRLCAPSFLLCDSYQLTGCNKESTSPSQHSSYPATAMW